MAAVACLEQHMQVATCKQVQGRTFQHLNEQKEQMGSYRRLRVQHAAAAPPQLQRCIACGASLHKTRPGLQWVQEAQLANERTIRAGINSNMSVAVSNLCLQPPRGSHSTSIAAYKQEATATAAVDSDSRVSHALQQRLPQHMPEPVAAYTPSLNAPEPLATLAPSALVEHGSAPPAAQLSNAVTPSNSRGPLLSNHNSHHHHHHQQQHVQGGARRPQGFNATAMRQLLQQQVQAATSWQQLQQLLEGRQQQLTLKHLSLMVVQVARLQAAEQRQLQQQLYQQQRYRLQQQDTHQQSVSHSSRSKLSAVAPADLLPATPAKGLEPFLQQLAAAVHEALLKEQCEMMQQLIDKHAAASAVASEAAAPAEEGSSSSSTSCSSSYKHAPGPLSSYLADILWGFAKLNYTPQQESMLLLWVEAFATVAPAADAVSYSQALWALGQLQFWPGQDVLDCLAHELHRRMATVAAQATHQAPAQHSTVHDIGSIVTSHVHEQQLLKSRALSNILWAFAVIGYPPPADVLASIWAGSMQGLPTASPQALSNMIWAVASLDITPSKEWMNAWQDAALAGMQQQHWNCADIANAAWALGKFANSSKLRDLLPPLSWRLALMRAARVAAGGSGSSASAAAPRELVAMAWGLTAAGVAFSKTFAERLLIGISAQRIHLKAREWCQLLAVLAKQGVTPPVVWQRSSQAVLQQRLRFCSSRDFATAVWALAQLGVPPRQAWKERFFAESYGQLFFLTPSSTCALVWGLGRLHWRPPRDWQDRLFLETYTKLAGFRAAELAGTLHGLAQLQLQPPVQWMWQATAVMALAGPDMFPQELTTCLWALCKLRYRPPEPWLAALADRGAALLPSAWQQQDNNGEASRSIALEQLQQQQQKQDTEEAQLRRRRQQLLQQVKEMEQQQRQLQQQRPLQPQRHQQQSLHGRQQQMLLQQQWQRQQQSLLQLRGDLELLEQRMKKGSYGTGVADRQQQQQQAKLSQQATDAETFTPNMQPTLTAVPLQQQQHRCLGAGDVRVVLQSLEQLQYVLQEDHPLMLAAQQVGIASSTTSRRRKASRGVHAAAVASSLPRQAPEQSTSDDQDDVFPGSAARVDVGTSADSSGSVKHIMHVAANTALARRRRHGMRYTAPKAS